MESVALSTGEQLHLALFVNVANAPVLLKAVLGATIEFALIDASKVLDTFLVAIAANNASYSQKYTKLTAKNIPAEILLNLSTGTNIGFALKTLGIQAETKNILVVRIGGEREAIQAELNDLVKGEVIPLSRLGEFADVEEIKKFYKLKGDPSKEEMLNLITSSLALKVL